MNLRTLLVLATALTTSCAFVEERKVSRNEVLSAKRVSRIKERTEVHIGWVHSNSELLLRVESTDTCQSVEQSLVEKLAVTERTVDGVWKPYVGGAASATAGAVSFAIAPFLSSKKGTNDQGEETASPQTTANVLGGLFMAAAAGVLGYAVVQSFRAIDSEESVGRSVRETVKAEKPCRRQPLPDVEVSLHYPPPDGADTPEDVIPPVTAVTDKNGVAALPVFAVEDLFVKDYRLAIPEVSVEVAGTWKTMPLPVWFLMAHEETREENRKGYARSLYRGAVRELKAGMIGQARTLFEECQNLRTGLKGCQDVEPLLACHRTLQVEDPVSRYEELQRLKASDSRSRRCIANGLRRTKPLWSRALAAIKAEEERLAREERQRELEAQRAARQEELRAQAEERRQEAEDRKLHAWGKRQFGRAKMSARSAVSERLKSPGTANWVSTRVLDHKNGKFLVHVVVDATNSFGGYIRGAYCVVLTLDMKKKDTYFINPVFGIQECSRSPNDFDIGVVKQVNSW